MTAAATIVLMDRVHELEVTLSIAESRLRLLATGGTLPRESLLDVVAEIERVLKGDKSP